MAQRDVAAEPTTELDSDDVVTVDELNTELAAVIESADDLHHDYVVGDVTDCGVANGNVHFDLVADDASIHCVVFGFRRDDVDATLDDETRVAVQGDLSYYEEQGSCSILVTDAVAVGDSAYQRRYEATRDALAEDGLLDDDRKQSLPDLPSTVGLVTSADSDAASDAVTAIHGRYPDVDITLHHAGVQGEGALEELLEAISKLDRDAEVDVLVVTRGGGADRTLRVFDEPALCRAIARTETPVCVGIGHEDDRTLADEVADRRVMTPTHAGEVVPEKHSCVDRVDALQDGLRSAYEGSVARSIERREQALERAFESHVESTLTGLDNSLRHTSESLARNRLRDLEQRLQHTSESAVESQLTDFDRRLRHATESLTEMRLADHERRLSAAYDSVEQARAFEAEKEAALAEAQRDVTTVMDHRHRRYRIAAAALGLLVLLLVAYILV